MDDIDNPQAGADDPTNATGNDNNNTTNNNTDEPPGNTQDAPDAPTLNTNTTNPTGADELLNRIEQARTTNNITAIVQAINGVDISTLPINEDTLIASVETYRKSTEDERNRMDKPSLLQLLEAQARVSRMTLPNNVNNESRAVIRNRIDDSIRQLALTEILSQSVQTNDATPNTQNVQRQQPQTGVTTHNATATEEQLNKVSTNMFKWAEKLIINKNADFIRFEPWSIRFISYLRAAGGHTLANAIEGGASKTTDITTSENRLLHSILTVLTMGVPHNLCRKHRNTLDGLAVWRAMVDNFLGDVDATADDIRLEIHQLKVSDFEDIVPKLERLDMLHERLFELGETWHKQDKQVISSYKALVNEAPTYQQIISAFKHGHKSERTSKNLRDELIRFSTAQRKLPSSKPVYKVDPKRRSIVGECAKCGYPVRDAKKHKLDGSNCKTKPGFDRWTLQDQGKWTSSYRSSIPKPSTIGLIRPIARVTTSSISSDQFIIDTGSPYHFAQRHYIDDGTYVASNMTFSGADGTQFLSTGYGNVTLIVSDTNNVTRKLLLKGVRVGTSNIIGNILERDSPYEFRTKDSLLTYSDANDDYAIPLEYNGHYVLSPTTSTYLAISSGNDLTHRRLAHAFHKPDMKCHACMETKSFNKRGTHGKQKNFNLWLEASPGTRFAFDIKYMPKESPTPYVLRFIDPVSGYIYDYFLDTRKSDDYCDTISAFIKDRRREGFAVDFLHGDQEFNTNDFRELCDTNKIIYTFAAPGESTQNAHVERSFRTTFDAFRACMIDMNINNAYMTYIWRAITHVHNRTPRAHAKDKRSPIEILYKVPPPDTTRFRVLGSRAFVGIAPGARTSKNQLIRKLAGTFVGYDEKSRGYLVIPHNSTLPVSSTNVEFDETSLAARPLLPPARPVKIYDISRDTGHWQSNTDMMNNDSHYTDEHAADPFIFRINTSMPFNYKQAMSRDSKRFFPPFEKEILSHMALGTFEIIKKDDVAKLNLDPTHILNTRTLFREKTNASGEFVLDKAREIVDGRFAIQGVHFDQVYSPVSMHSTFMSFIAAAQRHGRLIYQADVQNAYVNAFHDPNYPVYLNPVAGWNDVIDANASTRPELQKLRTHPGDLFKLRKALYGLGSSGRDWNTEFTRRLLDYGLTQSYADPCLFVTDSISVIIYVDDLLISTDTYEHYKQFLDYLQRTLTIKDLGLAKNVLGVVLHQRIDDGKLQDIQLEQSAFIQELKQLATVSPTPTSFRSVIGQLSWVTRTRPEASLMVNMLSQHQNNPTNKHAKLANRLIQYLQRTNATHITHNQNFAELVDDTALHCFVDAAYADDASRRSRTAFLIFYGTRLIQWQTKLTSIIALSSTEAEYIALTELDKAVRHLTTVLTDLGIEPSATRYYCDAQSAIKLVQRQSSTQNTKHIDVRYHYIRERLRDGAFELHKIHTSDNPADLLTKILPRAVRRHHHDVILGNRWPAVAFTANLDN